MRTYTLTDTEVHGVLLNALTMARNTWEADAEAAEAAGNVRLTRSFTDALHEAKRLAELIESAETVKLENCQLP